MSNGWLGIGLAQTAVTPDEVHDADFYLQGEYVGQSSRSCQTPTIGIQVVALGNDQFQARWFEGGLPGSGPVVLPGYVLRGRRQADGRVLLADEQGRQVILSEGIRQASWPPWGEWALAPIVRAGPTLGMRPPPDAVVLFDGGPTDKLSNVRMATDGSLLAGATTTFPVHDFHLHVEFRTPYMPKARGQGRGNSGIYIQRRYEVQILDSFGLAGKYNECGALYQLAAPALNLCLPPLAWQTYDIDFRAARWNEQGQKIRDAQITVFHNGVAVHYHRVVPRKTGAGQAEGPQPLPIYFQDHGNPVTFRNIWLVMHDSSPDHKWTTRLDNQQWSPSALWKDVAGPGRARPLPRWFCR